jgi:hypothetical protein
MSAEKNIDLQRMYHWRNYISKGCTTEEIISPKDVPLKKLYLQRMYHWRKNSDFTWILLTSLLLAATSHIAQYIMLYRSEYNNLRVLSLAVPLPVSTRYQFSTTIAHLAVFSCVSILLSAVWPWLRLWIWLITRFYCRRRYSWQCSTSLQLIRLVNRAFFFFNRIFISFGFNLKESHVTPILSPILKLFWHSCLKSLFCKEFVRFCYLGHANND